MEDEVQRLLQRAARDEIESGYAGDAWLTLYAWRQTADGNEGRYAALVSPEQVDEVLSRSSWELHADRGGMPELIEENGETVYRRFGMADVEPLVFKRWFHELKPSYLELSEEFRHFHGLYQDHQANTYTLINDDGEEELVAEVVDGEMRVSARRLKQFLSARGMHLAMYYDRVVFSAGDLGSILADERRVERHTSTIRYSFGVSSDPGTRDRRISRLIGKVLIPPSDEAASFVEPKRYVAFITGLGPDGRPIEASCEPDGLNNLFGKNPDAAPFLTPIVFRREVLKKYYDDETKYRVDDGYLHCGSLWGLRMDNQGERVTVFLGDLGQSLPYGEQLYWRSFNVLPKGDGKDLSETAHKRAFLVEFTDASAPDLRFKSALTDFAEKWHERHGWYLFRPVREDDAHVFGRLRSPLNDSKSEFEDMLISLTKLLIEALNDAELVRALGSSVPDERSIGKFERYLGSKGYPHAQRDVALLKRLYDVRSKAVAHRKGDSFKKLAATIGLGTRSSREIFNEWLESATSMIHSLTAHFLIPDRTGPSTPTGADVGQEQATAIPKEEQAAEPATPKEQQASALSGPGVTPTEKQGNASSGES